MDSNSKSIFISIGNIVLSVILSIFSCYFVFTFDAPSIGITYFLVFVIFVQNNLATGSVIYVVNEMTYKRVFAISYQLLTFIPVILTQDIKLIKMASVGFIFFSLIFQFAIDRFHNGLKIVNQIIFIFSILLVVLMFYL